MNSAIRNRNRFIEKLREHDLVVTKCLEPDPTTATSPGSSLNDHEGLEMKHLRNISSASSVDVPIHKR